MKRKTVIVLVVIIIVIISFLSGLFILLREEELSIPEPGEINITYYRYYDYGRIYNFSMRFYDDSLIVYSSYDDRYTDEFVSLEQEYNRSIGENIWYPLMKGFIKNRGNDPNYDCCCMVDKPIQMIDAEGREVVHGEFNDHKFFVYVKGVFTRIWTNKDDDIQNGSDNLISFCEHLADEIYDEYNSRFTTYIFTTVNEPSLISDDDDYYHVGGGVTGPHILLVSDFANDSFSGEIRSVNIHVKYKTDEDFSNNNTLKIIYEDIIETECNFTLSNVEVVKYYEVSDEFDLETLDFSEISLEYENPGGIPPTPSIYFDYIWITVRCFHP